LKNSNLEYIATSDSSYTLYSREYEESYHSSKDGAVFETYSKHIEPAFKYFDSTSKDSIYILDICFGLGYNTLATVEYIKKVGIDKNVFIYSPELNETLLDSLVEFEYPKEFQKYLYIIKDLIQNEYFKEGNIYIELFRGDAREYITKLEVEFDIIYQDAFSPTKNRALWSYEYFSELYQQSSPHITLTTYSISTSVKMSLSEAGFKVYTYLLPNGRKSLIASKNSLNLDEFDRVKKLKNSPNTSSIRDF
jgi:tRNA U34 5-methylaminomethyl-2-thiouridine-forming methyltransferase MnmC